MAIIVDLLTRMEADMLFKDLYNKYNTKTNDIAFDRFFRDAFQAELQALITCSSIAELTRSYYSIRLNNHDYEALVGMNYDDPNKWFISSIGSIPQKNRQLRGWQYLRALLEQVLLQRCEGNKSLKIQCYCQSKGSRRAFCELSYKGHLPDEWTLELSDNNGSICANLWLKKNLK